MNAATSSFPTFAPGLGARRLVAYAQALRAVPSSTWGSAGPARFTPCFDRLEHR